MRRGLIGQSAPWLAGVVILLLAGFWLRLSFFLGEIYHIDEFISMLAASMVARRGLPVLPSGLFYDHGLLFSFISGACVALLGFSEEVARWPSLLAGVLTLAVYYTAGRRLFDSPAAGLLAAALAALDTLSIEWAGRARMYALAHLFVLVSLFWLLHGVFQRPGRRSRYFFLLGLAAALFSHTVSFIMIPVLALLVVVFTLAYRRGWLRQPGLWGEATVGLALLGAAMAVVVAGHTGSLTLRDSAAGAAAPVGLDFLRGLFAPGLGWSRFDDLVGFFLSPAYRWLLPVIGLGLLMTLHRLRRRGATFRDMAFLFLVLVVSLTVLEMGLLFTSTWRKERYLYIVASPAFWLASGAGLAWLLDGLVTLVSRLVRSGGLERWREAGLAAAGLALILGVYGPAAWKTSHSHGTGNYHTAFNFVRDNWQPGDRVMTVHPSAAYLYLGRSDYYASQRTARVLMDDESEQLIDRYVGSELLDSVEAFNAALSQEGRVWFVVDTNRLFARFEPYFTQQVFAQMDLARRTGGVLVFLSRPYPRPVPAEPAVALNANLGNLIELGGYSLDLEAVAPDRTVQLGLYWRPETGQLTRVYKVFVQLRNEQDEIVAQADHYIFENFLTADVLEEVGQTGEWLRDTADLALPESVAPGTYRLMVGLYDPDTFERVPVLPDRSGENAVLLETVSIP
jgi:hypothetical protein